MSQLQHMLSLRHMGLVVAVCGVSCPAACGILVFLPGIEPTSSALEGGLLTTGPPGKSPEADRCEGNLKQAQSILDPFHPGSALGSFSQEQTCILGMVFLCFPQSLIQHH